MLVKRARSRHCAAEHVTVPAPTTCLPAMLQYCTYLYVCVACNKLCCRLLHHPTPLIGVEHVLMNCGRWYSLVGPPSQACAPTPSPDVARSSRCRASRCCSRTGGEVGGVGTRPGVPVWNGSCPGWCVDDGSRDDAQGCAHKRGKEPREVGHESRLHTGGACGSRPQADGNGPRR